MVVIMVYVIIVYDVTEDNNRNVRTFLRRYLDHTQNSVFEGVLKKSECKSIINKLESKIDDSEKCIVYMISSDNYLDREAFGENDDEYDSTII